MLCGYKGGDKRRPGAIRHTFSHHAYSFPYTALENNPLHPAKVSGTLQNLFDDRIRKARKWAQLPQERRIKDGTTQTTFLRGEVDAGAEVSHATDLRAGTRRFLLIQGSSASLDLAADSVDYVVTDPPYFDSVQYSDLAAFFRVWLRRLVPGAARWDYDLADSAVDPQANGKGQYTDVLGGIFAECHRVLRKDHGRLIFTFHHWNPKGWTALTQALKRSGFVLLNRYVVHAENPVSVHISNLKALTHDAILVLAPIEAGQRQAWQLPQAVEKTDSLRFSTDCATALGWLLNSDLPDEAIEPLWYKLLE
jgi:putative DNA methylase